MIITFIAHNQTCFRYLLFMDKNSLVDYNSECILSDNVWLKVFGVVISFQLMYNEMHGWTLITKAITDFQYVFIHDKNTTFCNYRTLSYKNRIFRGPEICFLWGSLMNLMREFLEASNIHGLVHISKAESKWGKVLWTISVLASFCLAAWVAKCHGYDGYKKSRRLGEHAFWLN